MSEEKYTQRLTLDEEGKVEVRKLILDEKKKVVGTETLSYSRSEEGDAELGIGHEGRELGVSGIIRKAIDRTAFGAFAEGRIVEEIEVVVRCRYMLGVDPKFKN